MHCPLCSHEFDETDRSCLTSCPMASLQGCHLVCCPNCGYQMVDESKSGIARLLRRVLPARAEDGGGQEPGA